VQRLLIAISVFEAFIIAMTTFALFAIQLWRHTKRRRVAFSERAAYEALCSLAVNGVGDQTTITRLRALPRYAQLQVIIATSDSFGGGHLGRLRDVANRLGLTEKSEAWARSTAWRNRLRAARLISAIGAAEARFDGLLADSNFLVRAQAAEWRADWSSSSILLVTSMLDDACRLCRIAAQDAVLRIGPAAIEPLAQFLNNNRGKSLGAALRVAAKLSDCRFLPVALCYAADSDDGNRAAAAHVLAAIGGDAASEAVITLLEDASALVRIAALAALKKLACWPAAKQVALCLHDPAWAVRKEAALVLLSFGSPGVLMLRCFAQEYDSDVASIALETLATGVAAGANT
jgi:hypothetical protein